MTIVTCNAGKRKSQMSSHEMMRCVPVAAMNQGRVSPKKRPAGRMAPAVKAMK